MYLNTLLNKFYYETWKYSIRENEEFSVLSFFYFEPFLHPISFPVIRRTSARNRVHFNAIHQLKVLKKLSCSFLCQSVSTSATNWHNFSSTSSSSLFNFVLHSLNSSIRSLLFSSSENELRMKSVRLTQNRNAFLALLAKRLAFTQCWARTKNLFNRITHSLLFLIEHSPFRIPHSLSNHTYYTILVE